MSIAIIVEQQTSGTAGHGGAAPVADSMNQRVLNTVIYCDINGLTLGADNTVNVPAGRYEIDAVVPAEMCGRGKALLWDFTNGVQLEGTASQSQASGQPGPLAEYSNENCLAFGVVDVLSPIQLGVKQYFNLSSGNTGFGVPTSDGSVETYTIVKIRSL